MNNWIKTFNVAGRSGNKAVSFRLDPKRARRLKAYSENETRRLGRRVSQTAIVETLLERDKGFRNTPDPETEIHGNNKDSAEAHT